MGGVITLLDISGYEVPKLGKTYQRVITDITRKLQHTVQQAKPITVKMLNKQIAQIIDITDEKQLATWVAALFGFHLFLRKTNLIPTSTKLGGRRQQLSRRDIRQWEDLLLVKITCTKTVQFNQRALKLPMAERDCYLSGEVVQILHHKS